MKRKPFKQLAGCGVAMLLTLGQALPVAAGSGKAIAVGVEIGQSAAVFIAGLAFIGVVAIVSVLVRCGRKPPVEAVQIGSPAESEEQPAPPVEAQVLPVEEQEPSEEDREAARRRLLYPDGKDPSEEESFFQGIERRKELKRRLDRGEIDQEQYEQAVREILLHM